MKFTIGRLIALKEELSESEFTCLQLGRLIINIEAARRNNINGRSSEKILKNAIESALKTTKGEPFNP